MIRGIYLRVCEMGFEKKDRISVIVPIYNVEKYLSDCLELIIRLLSQGELAISEKDTLEIIFAGISGLLSAEQL